MGERLIHVVYLHIKQLPFSTLVVSLCPSCPSSPYSLPRVPALHPFSFPENPLDRRGSSDLWLPSYQTPTLTHLTPWRGPTSQMPPSSPTWTMDNGAGRDRTRPWPFPVVLCSHSNVEYNQSKFVGCSCTRHSSPRARTLPWLYSRFHEPSRVR